MITFVYEQLPELPRFPHRITAQWDTTGLSKSPDAITRAVHASLSELQVHEHRAAKWLKDNFGIGRWGFTRSANNMRVHYYFHTQQDAVQFRLAMS